MKSHKVRLEPNNVQRTKFLQHAGVARHAWNWGLSVCKDGYEKGEKLLDSIDLHKKLVAEVKSINPWYYEVSKFSSQEALRNLEKSYRNFFREFKDGTVTKKRTAYRKSKAINGRKFDETKLMDIGKPKFKKRGVNDSFYLEDPRGVFYKGNKIKLPKIGWVKTSEVIPADIIIKNVTISRTADQWFLSYHQEHTPIHTEKKSNIAGVDLGIKVLATMSDGTTAPSVNAYRKAKRKLKLAQRRVSKKFIKGSKTQSNNYKKAKLKVAKIHQRIANVRKDAIHKLTTNLSKNHAKIVIEDLNVAGMVKNHKLASAILDGGFGEFRRQLEYKCKWYGSELIVADRFFASSKICSCCGNKKDILKLSDRVYNCTVCGLIMDRDLNAAKNLENYAVKLVSGEGCRVLNNQPSSLELEHCEAEANSKRKVCISFE